MSPTTMPRAALTNCRTCLQLGVRWVVCLCGNTIECGLEVEAQRQRGGRADIDILAPTPIDLDLSDHLDVSDLDLSESTVPENTHELPTISTWAADRAIIPEAVDRAIIPKAHDKAI
eukprot:COSAG02_NODE_2157_length_9637_cov_4.208429_6_plen_117_part_00